MKKHLLMAAFCLGTAAAANAQTVVYSQNFEGTTQEIFNEGWNIKIKTGPSINYGVFNAVPEIQALGFSGKTMGATTYNTANNAPVHVAGTDIMITSPVIDIPQSQVTLSYRIGSMAVENNASSHYSMYIITEEDFNSTLLESKTAEDEATMQGESSSTAFTITDYNGQSVVLVFRLHESPTNAALLFDDIVISTGIMGSESFTANTFTVYPNPAKDSITIKGNEGTSFNSVSICDLNGRTILTKQFSGASDAQIDIAGLSAGMYIMTASSDKGTVTKKIIKQ